MTWKRFPNLPVLGVATIKRFRHEIDLLHNYHDAPAPYPTMRHFVTEMCTCVHISVTKWCIVGYLSNALWDLWYRPIAFRFTDACTGYHYHDQSIRIRKRKDKILVNRLPIICSLGSRAPISNCTHILVIWNFDIFNVDKCTIKHNICYIL